MEDERWRKIEDLFHRALVSSPDERAVILNANCVADDEVRKEVESLLMAYQRAGFTDSPVLHESMQILEHSGAAETANRKLGPYRILRELGRGGMGVVYLAARADESFEKLVAIKLLPRGLEAEDLVNRFRAERQILANLDHPNITRLLDGGTTEDGLPYLVMEYIEGVPVDEYCDTRRLNITGRLFLFQQICAAVRYAHQNLVVHRDIKPSNVLVTENGVPRLLDFGIAKLLTPGTAGNELTATALRPLTPEYASPEQIRGGAIGTSTDIYSLGVLLYRLLTGRRPYRAEPSSATAIERAICEEEPVRPSEAVRESPPDRPDAASEIAAVREGTIEKLSRRLAGDLDNIVLMAMRKEPQRRYASADQFSNDLSRHLHHLPVIARADTSAYRMRKFVRRNRAGVAVTVLLFFTLVAGLATTLWQAHVAQLQRDRARVEQAKANRIKLFLTDMLTYSSPDYTSSNPTKNRDAKVSEVVAQAAKRAATELADQPEVLTEVQATIGGVYASEGRYEEAEPILRTARERSIRLYGLNSDQTASISDSLANVLLEKGNPTEADALFRQDIGIERLLVKQGHGDPAALAKRLAAYGGMLDQRNDTAAEKYLKEALQYSWAFTGKDRVIVAMLYNDVGNEAGYRGDSDEMERCLRRSLEEYRKLPPGTYVEMGTTLSNLGAVLIGKGKYTEAEPFVLEGLELRRRVFGDSHPSTAGALFRLSDLRYHQARYHEAEAAARESLEVYRRALSRPQDSTLYTNPLVELGQILDKLGRFKEAESVLRQALEIRTRLLPKGNQLIARAETILGECLILQRRYGDAEPLLLDSYRIYGATTLTRNPRRIETTRQLVDLYRAWGKPTVAETYAKVIPAPE
jgi:eukaryotic-like serine/threonine-protein kinase